MPFPTGWFFIENVHSHKVLDISKFASQHGGPLILYRRKESEYDNQLWKYDNGVLINKHSNLVIEIFGERGEGDVQPNSIVVQNARHVAPNNVNQLWEVDEYDYILPHDKKLCISVKDDKFEDDQPIVVDDIRGFPSNPKQQWIFKTV